MKKLKTFTMLAASALILTAANNSSAGTLTITSGPTFSPAPSGSPSYLTSNTIAVQNPQPQLVKILGAATITQPASTVSQIAVQINGNFSASSSDIFSYFYNFSISLSSAAPVSFEIRADASAGSAPFGPFPFSFTTNDQAIAQGTSNYTGQGQSALPPLAFVLLGDPITGTFTGQLILKFSAPQAGDTLTINIPGNSIDFQVAPTAIPEPSTYALFALGLAGLVVWNRRRAAATV